MGLVSGLAEAVNTREDGLRLMLSILAGYPLSALHRTFLYNKSAQTQHVCFVAIGLFLYWFNYGEHCLQMDPGSFILVLEFVVVLLEKTCLNLELNLETLESIYFQVSTCTTPSCPLSVRMRSPTSFPEGTSQ